MKNNAHNKSKSVEDFAVIHAYGLYKNTIPNFSTNILAEVASLNFIVNLSIEY